MIHPARILGKMSRTGGVVLLALSCCACAGPHSLSRFSNPRSDAAESGPVQAIYRETVRGESELLEQPRAGVVRLSRRGTTVNRPAASVPGPRTPSSAVRQVSHAQPGEACPPFTITECPPVPRWGAPSPNPFAQGMLGCQCETTALAERYPDEYLCDGGDRALPVHYDSSIRAGLDTEDTVAEFTDHTGKNRVRPTNRVCVYAPRFSTMRTISRPHEGMNLNEIAGVGTSVSTDQMHMRLKATRATKP